MESSVSYSRRIGTFLARVLAVFAVLLILLGSAYAKLFGPTSVANTATEEFLVQPDETIGQVAEELTAKGFVRESWIFHLAYLRESYGKPVRPGGYELAKSMDAWTIANTLVQPPYMAWIKIPVGVRKEQIANILTTSLGCLKQQNKNGWRSRMPQGKTI